MKHKGVETAAAAIAILVLAGPPAPARADAPAADKPAGPGAAGHVVLKLADDVTMKLVRVPAGKFLMGSDTTERFRTRDARESPRTKPRYRLDNGLLIDVPRFPDEGSCQSARDSSWQMGYEYPRHNSRLSGVTT